MQPAAMREYHSRSSANCLKLTLKKAFSWIIFNSVKLVLGLEIWTVQLFKIEQNWDIQQEVEGVWIKIWLKKS